MNIKFLSSFFQIILWFGTFVLTIIWIFWDNPPFEPEPLTVALGLIATASSTILNKFEDKLEIEEFCTANALAIGYVNNFIEPVLTQLIKDNNKPIFYIFIPQKLNDLLPKNIERLKSELAENELLNKTLTLNLSEGRGARDVMTVYNSGGSNVYFDFPNTLLTLTSRIDYKLTSKKNSFNGNGRTELGQLYISRFKETLEKELVEVNLFPKYVKFTDSVTSINID